MKLNIGKLLGKVARAAKDNPEIALAVVGLAAPSLAVKVAKTAAKVKVARKIARAL